MKEYIQTLGIIIASFTAIYGINAWRRELRGKKEHDLAEEALSLFYECRDNLRAIRSPMAGSEEGSTRQKAPKETEEEREILNRAYVAFERYKKFQDSFNRLFVLRYRFMALFGREAAQPIEDLRLAVNKLFISAHMLTIYWKQQGRQHSEEAFEKHLTEMHKHENVFWGTFSKDDEYDIRVNNLMETFEHTCAAILRPKQWWSKLKCRQQKNRGERD